MNERKNGLVLVENPNYEALYKAAMFLIRRYEERQREQAVTPESPATADETSLISESRTTGDDVEAR